MLRELLIPLALAAIVGSMLLPLPPVLLDFLLVGNLLLALVLLASSLYVREPLGLSALPTMLLLATLFRLSLNIATSRAILSSGDAGRAVEAFGQVVIGGNLAVGLVIFLVITLIQFMVIGKGAERVAEVAARFALDAMPGRQMSIDADMRAGLMDVETARNGGPTVIAISPRSQGMGLPSAGGWSPAFSPMGRKNSMARRKTAWMGAILRGLNRVATTSA